MIAGLRYQIEILAATRTADEAGGGAIVYAPAAQIWAAVERLPSTAAIGGDRGLRLKRIEALIRARADVAIGGRLRFDSEDYEIVSIESDDARGRRLILIGEEAQS